MPARELEDKVADLIRQHLNHLQVRAGLLIDATIYETVAVGERLSSLTSTDANAAQDAERSCLSVIGRIDIKPGEMRIALSRDHHARSLEVDATRLKEDLLTFASPFQHRKRGVETKLIIGDKMATIDVTLPRCATSPARIIILIRSGKERPSPKSWVLTASRNVVFSN